MIVEVGERLEEHGVTIELTGAAKDWLADEGYDSQYGARPLRRAIQRHIENPLSKLILAQEFSEGSHIITDAGDDGLMFNKTESPLEALLV
jgi:ATP-dependent Clp protease ATP-binding subunit ClpC